MLFGLAKWKTVPRLLAKKSVAGCLAQREQISGKNAGIPTKKPSGPRLFGVGPDGFDGEVREKISVQPLQLDDNWPSRDKMFVPEHRSGFVRHHQLEPMALREGRNYYRKHGANAYYGQG